MIGLGGTCSTKCQMIFFLVAILNNLIIRTRIKIVNSVENIVIFPVSNPPPQQKPTSAQLKNNFEKITV